jgi:hemoglobin
MTFPHVAVRAANGKGLSDPHFDAVAKHLNDTLNELSVPAELVTQIMGAAAGLRNAVLDR